VSEAAASVTRARDRGGSLRLRGFRRLWIGESVSMLGSEMSELAVPLLAVLTLSATEAQLGFLRAAQFLPFLVATLLAGVWVDRVRRRPLLVHTNVWRAVLLGLIPLGAWMGWLGMPVVYALVFAAGIATVVFQLALHAYVPSLVPSGDLTDANGKLSASAAAAEVGGRAVGGTLVDLLGAPAAVAVDAASYAFAASQLARIREPEPAPEHAPGGRIRSEIGEGLRVVFADARIRALMAEAATFNLFNELFLTAFLLYAVRVLGWSGFAIGVLFSIAAVGALVGGLGADRAARRLGLGRALLAAMAIGNTAPLALVLVAGAGLGSQAAFVAVFATVGWGTAMSNVHTVTIRQSVVPGRLLGRMHAAYRLLSWGTIPIGAIMGGVLSALWDPRAAMLIGAAGIPLATLWVFFSPIRRMRQVPAQPDAEVGGEPA
jgi:MFS family permease